MMTELSLLDDLFTTAMNGLTMEPCDSLNACVSSYRTPDVDVIENKDNYVLSMDLPGLCQSDVDINVMDNILTISSIKSHKEEKKEEKLENKTTYLMKERRSFNFKRTFTLPRDVDTANISATFTNGVLDIVMARKEETKPRSIVINAA